jgi:tRNA pseudouridine13 synthase
MVETRAVGLPNYFDDQRFGSVGEKREFVGKELGLGNFERALWLAIAAPYDFDRSEEKREKELLRESWGKWSECVGRLRRGHTRDLVTYLAANPSDFKGAVVRLRPELQGLYLAAYQSYLWNRVLARWLEGAVEPASLASVDLKLGRVPVPVRMPPEKRPEWDALTLPLPSARIKADPTAAWSPIAEAVLKDEGLTLAELKVKGLHKPFFSKGDRAACVHPANLEHSSAPDDRNPGMQKLGLTFDLPRGSYATMLVKRLTAVIEDRTKRPAGFLPLAASPPISDRNAPSGDTSLNDHSPTP